MTSRSLCSKLIKEDVKRRLWMVCLFALGLFFMFPVVAAFEAGGIREAKDPALEIYQYGKAMESWMGFQNPAMTVVTIISAVIAGMSSFSYLNNRSRTDFYHGIPVRREALYVSNNISGILMFAVPYAVFLAAGVGVAAGNGVEMSMLAGVALQGYLLNMLYFILLYATAVIAAMLTGNLIVGLLGTGVFYFYAPLAAGMVESYFPSFFHNCFVWAVRQKTEVWYRLSPVFEYVRRVTEAYDGRKISFGGIVIDLAAAVILLVLGCLLYRKRPSEAAGKALAFPVSCPVIRIPIVFLASTLFGLFFWSMRRTTGWAVFGVVCGGVITHCMIEIIYNFDFKKMFGHWKQMLACVAAAFLFFCFFRYDWMGYDDFLPGEREAGYADVMLMEISNGISYGDLTLDEEENYRYKSENPQDYIFAREQHLDMETVRSMAEKILTWQAEHLDDGKEPEVEYDNDERERIYVNVRYQYMRGSGMKEVYRAYGYVPIRVIEEELEQIYAPEGSSQNPDTDGYKAVTFPVLGMSPDSVAEVRYHEYSAYTDTVLDDLSAGQRAELLTAYQEDLKEMKLSQLRDERPVGSIRFVDNEMKKAMDWRTKLDEEQRKNGYESIRYMRSTASYEMRHFMEVEYYPVYRSFVRVCDLLEQYGVVVGARSVMAPAERIEFRRYLNEQEEEYCVIEDPAQIKELMGLLQPDMADFGGLFYSEDVEINVRAKGEKGDFSFSASIRQGSLPEFVDEKLKAGRRAFDNEY